MFIFIIVLLTLWFCLWQYESGSEDIDWDDIED